MSSEPAGLPELIPPLLEELRHELAQYGEMLALLDQQQDHVLNPAPDRVMFSANAVHDQMTLIKQARLRRQSAQEKVVTRLRPSQEASFAQLISEIPHKFQGAIGILVRENSHLLERVRQKAHQNHAMLARSLEMMNQFLASLSPAPGTLLLLEGEFVEGKEPLPSPMIEKL